MMAWQNDFAWTRDVPRAVAQALAAEGAGDAADLVRVASWVRLFELIDEAWGNFARERAFIAELDHEAGATARTERPRLESKRRLAHTRMVESERDYMRLMWLLAARMPPAVPDGVVTATYDPMPDVRGKASEGGA
jgi:hypothetical protein